MNAPRRWSDELPSIRETFDALGLAYKDRRGGKVECPHCRARHTKCNRHTAKFWSNGEGFTCFKCGASGRAADAVSWMFFDESADFGDSHRNKRLREECTNLGLIDGSWRLRTPPPSPSRAVKRSGPLLNVAEICASTPIDRETPRAWALGRGLPFDVAQAIGALPDIFIVHPRSLPRGVKVSWRDNRVWFGLRGPTGEINDAGRRPLRYQRKGPKEAHLPMSITGRESGVLRTFGTPITEIEHGDTVLILEAPADAAVAWAAVRALGLPIKVMAPPGSSEVPKVAQAVAERGASRIILGTDADAAGREAEQRVIKRLEGRCIIDALKLPEGADLTDVVRKAPEGLPAVAISLSDTRRLDSGRCPDAAHTFDARLTRYLRPLSDYPQTDAPVVILACDLGSGKTHQLAHLARNRGTLYICHRQNLSKAGAHRLDLAFYKDLESTIRDARTAVCVNSLHRVIDTWAADVKRTHSGTPPVLIIDESESVAHALFHGTIPNGKHRTKADNGTILSRLRTLALQIISVGGQVFFADANAGRLTDELAKYLTGGAHRIETIEHRRPMPGHTTLIHESKACILEAINEAVEAGQRVALPVTSKATAQSLEERFVAKGVRAKAYTGDMSEADRASLEDPETAWSDLQVVIFNTSCDAGVSYDSSKPGVPPFDRVFLIGEDVGAMLGIDTLLQMSARIRGVTTIDAWIAPQLNHHRATDLDSIKREKLDSADATERAAARLKAYARTDGEGICYHPTDPELFELACVAEQWRRLRGRNVPEQWALWWKARGATVEAAPVPAKLLDPLRESTMAEELKASKERLREQHVEAVSNAEPMHHERPDGPLERAQAERYRLEQTFGPKAIDKALIDSDRNGEITKQAKRLAAVVLAHKALEGDQYAEHRLARADLKALATGFRFNARGKAHRVQSFVVFLWAAFGREQVDQLLRAPEAGPPDLKWPEGEDLALVPDRYFSLCKRLGLNPRLHTEGPLKHGKIKKAPPNKTIGQVLAHLGLGTGSSRERTSGGGRTRTYILNAEQWAITMSLAAPTICGALGHGVSFDREDGSPWTEAVNRAGAWLPAMPLDPASIRVCKGRNANVQNGGPKRPRIGLNTGSKGGPHPSSISISERGVWPTPDAPRSGSKGVPDGA